jgi:outer membrane protein assembly factor BamB
MKKLAIVLLAACSAPPRKSIDCPPHQHDDGTGNCVDDLSCGTGTEQVGSMCVASASDSGSGQALFCGPGTMQYGMWCLASNIDIDGGVVVCGPGTVLQGNACVPDGTGLTCGPGTVQQGSQCVPDGSGLTCGQGTVQQGNQCVPTTTGGIICGPGTVLFGIECLPSSSPPTDGGTTVDGGSEATAIAIDPAHDNAQPLDVVTSPLTPLWIAHFTGRVSYPLVTHGLAIVSAAESQPNVRALNLETGQVVWGPIVFGNFVSLAYDNGAVFALDANGNLASLNATTGARNWTIQVTAQSFYDPPPVAAGGLIFVNGSESGGTTSALHESNGAVAWTQNTFDGSEGAVGVSNGVVYEAEACDQLTAWTASTGTQKWANHPGCTGGGGAAPSIGLGLVFERDWAMGNVIVDLNGSPKGTFAGTAMPALHNGRALYLSSSTVSSVEIATGTLKWSFTGDGQLCTSPVVAGGGTGQVFVGSMSGHVFELDEATGTQLSMYDGGTPITCASENDSMSLASGHLLVPAGNDLIVY